MSASISYAAPYPALSHLSIDQICEMHALFIKGATVKSLLAEYGIESTQKQLQPLPQRRRSGPLQLDNKLRTN